PLHLQSKLVKKRCDYLKDFLFNFYSPFDFHIIRSILARIHSTSTFFARPPHFSLHIHTISLNSHIFRSKSIQFRSTLIFSAPYPYNFAQLPYFSLQIHTISLDPHIFRSISIQFRSTPIFFAPTPYNFARPSYFPLHIHTISLNSHIFRSISLILYL